MPNSPSITVIVSTYNRPDALKAVIEGLFGQTDQDFDIIIADDGSGPPTAACVEALQARSPVQLQHVWQPDDGFRLAMARNRGIAAARGDYLLFLDGDCVPQRDFVAQHRRLAQQGYMVTGSRILLDEAFTAEVVSGRVNLHQLGVTDLVRLRMAGKISKLVQLMVRLPDVGRIKQRFAFRRIKGCNLGIWRADLVTINGFDESFTGWGYEDSDAVLRLYNAGIRRKDGAFATEVFHLWHREAKRDSAASNKRIVDTRLVDKTVSATKGLQ